MKRSSHVRLPSPPIKQLASFTRFTRSRRRLADLFYVGTTDRNMSSSQWTTVSASSHLSFAVSQSHSVFPRGHRRSRTSSRSTLRATRRLPRRLFALALSVRRLPLCLPHRRLHRLSPSSCSVPPFQRRHARDLVQLCKVDETLGNTSIRTRGPPICRSS